MRKFLSVILSFIYLTLSIHAVVNMHYCSGNLKSIKINTHSEKCCCGSKEMNNGCCQDKEIIFTIDSDQNIAFTKNIIPEISILINYIIHNSDLFIDDQKQELKINNYEIPPPKLEPVWLLNCSLTYYG